MSMVQLCDKCVIQTVHLDKTAYVQPKIASTAHLTHVQRHVKLFYYGFHSPVSLNKSFHYVLIYNIIIPVKGICISAQIPAQEQVNFMKKKYGGGGRMTKMDLLGEEACYPRLISNFQNAVLTMLPLHAFEGCSFILSGLN